MELKGLRLSMNLKRFASQQLEFSQKVLENKALRVFAMLVTTYNARLHNEIINSAITQHCARIYVYRE